MIREYECHIIELNGYLAALSRLCGNGYIFGSRAYEVSDEIDNFIIKMISGWGDKNEFEYFGRKQISYKEIENRVVEIVFRGVLDLNNLPNDNTRNYAKKMIFEDINEFYGLFSTSQDENGVFHPLVTGPVYSLDIVNKNHVAAFYYLVNIGEYYVITYFIKKAVE